jgi:hypothetical protein
MNWADQVTEESGTLRAHNLGAAVCADGANGLKSISSIEARARGIYVEPGQFEVPLVAYHPSDEGPRSRWQPPGRAPMGLDAPENRTGPKMIWMAGPGAGAYVSPTVLVHPGYQQNDARRYFDSSAVPGWVIPRGAFAGTDVGLGDLAELSYEGRTVWAQAYDVGPADSVKLEISVEACTQLGIPNCARKGGSVDGLSITILPGSRRLTAEGGKVRPWTVDNVGRISEMAEAYAGRGGDE